MLNFSCCRSRGIAIKEYNDDPTIPLNDNIVVTSEFLYLGDMISTESDVAAAVAPRNR